MGREKVPERDVVTRGKNKIQNQSQKGEKSITVHMQTLKSTGKSTYTHTRGKKRGGEKKERKNIYIYIVVFENGMNDRD